MPRVAPSEASGTKAVVAVIVVPWMVDEPVIAPPIVAAPSIAATPVTSRVAI